MEVAELISRIEALRSEAGYFTLPSEAGFDLIGSARLSAHQLLGTYFGNEAELSQLGHINSLKYRIDGSNPLADGVTFFYDVATSGEDTPTASTRLSTALETRLPDLFFKGRRWSSLQWSEIFYEGFSPVAQAATKSVGLEGRRPLTPIRWLAENARHPHQKIRVAMGAPLDLRGPILSLPHVVDLPTLRATPIFRDLPDSLAQALFQFRTAAHAHRAGRPSCPEDELLKAFHEWDAAISAAKPHIPGQPEDCDPKILARLLYLFQFYDVPYSLDLFTRDGKTNDHRWYSALALSRELETDGSFRDLPRPEVEMLETLSVALNELARFDVEIRERVARDFEQVDNVVSGIDRCGSQFRVLAGATEQLLRSNGVGIGPQRGVVRVSSRVKDSAGAFTKFIRRSLSQIASSPPRPTLPPSSRRTTAFDRAKAIVESIPDMAGVRVSSAFEAHIPEILTTILAIPELKDSIERVKVIGCLANPEQARRVAAVFTSVGRKAEYEESMTNVAGDPHRASYRAIHVQLSLSPAIVKALTKGFPNPDGVNFNLPLYRLEIQVRSSMLDGWADVSHRMIYKPALRDFVNHFGGTEILSPTSRAAQDIEDAERRLEAARLAYSRLQRRFGDVQ